MGDTIASIEERKTTGGWGCSSSSTRGPSSNSKSLKLAQGWGRMSQTA